MGSKTRRSKINTEFEHQEDRVMRVLKDLKHRDLQRECILRGMSSDDAVNLDHHGLVSWFYKNFDNTQDQTRLHEHDAWVDDQLIKRGYKRGDALLSPALKFGFAGNIEEMEKPKELKPPTPSPVGAQIKKEPAKMDEKTGVRQGTKKAMTYELSLAGEDINEIVKKVIAAFPEAQEKSIKIWAKRALKGGTE